MEDLLASPVREVSNRRLTMARCMKREEIAEIYHPVPYLEKRNVAVVGIGDAHLSQFGSGLFNSKFCFGKAFAIS